jgi:phosphoglycerol transferase MdoB-like AlkP superfamily enzyme
VEKYASTVDLYPTICNLFALKTDLRYFVGDDIFSTEGGLVYWNDFSCWDGKTYVSGSQAANLSDSDYRLYYYARQRLMTSWNTFRYNYFSSVNPIKNE